MIARGLLLVVVIYCSLYAVSGQGCAGARFLDPIPPPSYSDVLFPLPSSYSFGSDTYTLDPITFTLITQSQSTILQQALQRYRQLLFQNSISVAPPAAHGAGVFETDIQYRPLETRAVETVARLDRVIVEVWSSNETLQHGTDESYFLNVTEPVAILQANTVFGALRGLETFSQLVTSNASYSGLTISGAPWLIHDSPRFLHRGLLIDTARHYLNISTIQRTIDAMSYAKMNVLHWHLTDAQSFPYVAQTYPNLSNGKFSTQEVYTQDNLRALVQYATARGVRIMVEIDTPGHTASWGVGYPQITVCRDKTRQQGFCAENPCGQLDPSVPLTFEIVYSVIKELSQIFPENFFHFGSDEFVYDCWNTTQIKTWMARNNLPNFTSVLDYYEQQIHAFGASFGKTPVNFQEVFDAGISLPSNSIIEVWEDFASVGRVVRAGYRAIVSNYDAWYLDCGGNTWCPYCTWLDAYNNEPLSGNTYTPAEAALIIGGEAALWSELVTDRNFDSKMWPRAAAVAERLWSPQTTTNAGDAFTRLLKHNCRLASRNLNTDALIPGSNPYTCTFIQE